MVTQDPFFRFWVSLSGIAFGAVILRRNFDLPGDVTRGIAFGWFPYRFRGKVKLRLWFRPDIKKMNYNSRTGFVFGFGKTVFFHGRAAAVPQPRLRAGICSACTNI